MPKRQIIENLKLEKIATFSKPRNSGSYNEKSKRHRATADQIMPDLEKTANFISF